jgi:hypothetical protein
MNRKNPNAKKDQVEDATSTQEAPSPQLRVSNRPILGHDITLSAPAKDALIPESSPKSAQAPSKSKLVIPVNGTRETPEDPKQTVASDKTSERADKGDDSSKDDVTEAQAASPAEKTPAAPAVPSETEAQNVPNETTPDEAEDDADTEQDKPNPENQKAAEEAAERERKLQEYTDSHQFFVPINAVAQKRSIKVSIGLTIMLLLLAILLIDLMLDTGIVLLLQKIPHTHFFNLGSH